MQLSEAALTESRNLAIEQKLKRFYVKRVAELGVAEAVIQRQGAERIVIEFTGCSKIRRVQRIIRATQHLNSAL